METTKIKISVMGRLFLTGASLVFLCLMTIFSAGAETISSASLKKGYTPAELDQMLAPVALYPDALLLQVLMAATYPAEVSEAGRWLDANPNLKGEVAIDAAEDFEWNAGVQSLLAFPEVLSTMSSNMGWTVKLGNAFNTQREEVMERIQRLRRQARAVGNLKSDERMNVVTEDNNIAILPVSPEVVYVPYYNPTLIYGSWNWPGYAPYYWAPWRGYGYSPGYYSSGFMWGSGIWFSYTRFYGRADWHHRRVYWNPPPPRHPAPGHVRPGSKPRPESARPGNRSEPGRSQQMRPGSRPQSAGIGHHSPSAKNASRSGNERIARQEVPKTKRAQRPDRSASSRPAGDRATSVGKPSRVASSERPAVTRPSVNHHVINDSHSRPSSRPSASAGRPVGEVVRQAGAVERIPSRPAMSQPGNASRRAVSRSSDDASFQGDGSGGGARGGQRR